ncbi:MAG: hypothetical protein VYB65_11340 [Myxococcota bacterium]|nr:hypothetical protein [Myxococcota bacterium]
MGDKKSIPDLIDKRLQERLLDRGDLTADAFSSYLEQLPDLADEVETIDLGGEASDTADSGEQA